MDLEKRFIGTFLPGRKAYVAKTPSIAEMWYNGEMCFDSVLARITLDARDKGIAWVSGGVEFIANHEEGHWKLGEPNICDPDTRRLCRSEARVNVYAFAKSPSPIEDYSVHRHI